MDTKREVSFPVEAPHNVSCSVHGCMPIIWFSCWLKSLCCVCVPIDTRPCPAPWRAETTPAQSSRMKEAAHGKRIAETNSNSNIEIDLASVDVEEFLNSTEEAGGPTTPVPDTRVSASISGEVALKVLDLDGASGTQSKLQNDSSIERLSSRSPGESSAEGLEGQTNHLAAVAVCVTGAVMSSMLQFSFVYGELISE